MNSTEKLKEVENSILRILTLIPEHSIGWYCPLKDIQRGIERFLNTQYQNDLLAEEFSKPGTLKRFLLTRGFMPHDEADAEVILDSIIRENEK